MTPELMLWLIAGAVSLVSLAANVALHRRIKRDLREMRALNATLEGLISQLPEAKP